MKNRTLDKWPVRRLILPVFVCITLVSAWIAMGFITSAESARQNEKAHKKELRNAVEKPDGTPRDGRDPAKQKQNSLAAAASKGMGPGLRTDKPAKHVKGKHDKKVHPHDVLPDPKTEGMNSAGCIVGYGQLGEQCLPTNGDHKKITCEYVRNYFPDGVVVTGKDTLKLDKNKDKLACGRDDK